MRFRGTSTSTGASTGQPHGGWTMSADTPERTSPSRQRRAAVARLAARPRGGLITEVYELFPYAIMVVDTSGRLITANRRAREILERGDPGDGITATCCGLFGCRLRGGPLERCCITQLALQTAK